MGQVGDIGHRGWGHQGEVVGESMGDMDSAGEAGGRAQHAEVQIACKQGVRDFPPRTVRDAAGMDTNRPASKW